MDPTPDEHSDAARYAATSFWLETCGDDLTPRPALDGPLDADVAILGAGFTGLWTAYYLLTRKPGLRVVILESETAGFGASGRNGGWCSSKLNIDVDALARKFGREAAMRLLRALEDTVAEIGRVCEAEGIAAEYAKVGSLFVARFPHHVPMMEALYSMYERYGCADTHALLDAAETARRIRVPGGRGAFWSSEYALVHPARLARGLARVVERKGGRIFERTRVTAVVPGHPARLRTARGDVRAAAVVLAGEAYLTRLPGLRRQLLPVYSLIVLTEPLSDDLWRSIGWEGRECLASFRLSVDYLSRTSDGRILFGGRGAPYRFGSRITDAFDRDEATHAMLRDMARAWFPGLAGTRFTHAWGGPLGMPRDWMPTVSWDASRGIATARGYTGHGVAASNLAGRLLGELVLGRRSELTALPLVNHRSPSWEPEPLRWLAVRHVQRAFAALDARAEKTGRAPDGKSLAERIAGA